MLIATMVCVIGGTCCGIGLPYRMPTPVGLLGSRFLARKRAPRCHQSFKHRTLPTPTRLHCSSHSPPPFRPSKRLKVRSQLSLSLSLSPHHSIGQRSRSLTSRRTNAASDSVAGVVVNQNVNSLSSFGTAEQTTGRYISSAWPLAFAVFLSFLATHFMCCALRHLLPPVCMCACVCGVCVCV